MAMKELQERLRGYLESDKDWNEENTRNYFINPVLRELGHDPENPTQVKHNDTKSDAGGIPDYTILDDEGEPMLFVEAKPINLDLENYARTDEFKKKINYASNAGKRWVAITNGRDWWLCDSKKPTSSANFGEKIVFKTSLREADFVSNIEYLSRQALREKRLEKFNVQQEIKNSFERLFSDPSAYDDLIKFLQDHGGLNPNIWAEVKEMLCECRVEIGSITDKIEIPTGEEKPPVTPKPEEGIKVAAGEWGEWPEDLRGKVLNGANCPGYVCIKDRRVDIRSWNGLLQAVADWLVGEGKIRGPLKLPDKRSGRESMRFIINDVRVQAGTDKQQHLHWRNLENSPHEKPLYVYVKGSPQQCLLYAFYLLEHFGYKPGRDFLKPPKDWKP